jgi:hypothetical protein
VAGASEGDAVCVAGAPDGDVERVNEPEGVLLMQALSDDEGDSSGEAVSAGEPVASCVALSELLLHAHALALALAFVVA